MSEEYKEVKVKVVLGNRERTFRGLEIPIEWEGKSNKVIVRKLGHGERAELIEKFSNVEVKGKNMIPKFSYRDMVMHSMTMCITEAPFPIEWDYIYYDLEPELGKKIYRIIEGLNELSEVKKKESDGQSNMEQTAQT